MLESNRPFDPNQICCAAGQEANNCAQGPQGNVSSSVRKTLQDRLKAVDVRVANFAKLNVPERVQDELVRTYFTITNITESEYDHQLFRFPQTPNSNNDSKVGDAMTTMDAERFPPLSS